MILLGLGYLSCKYELTKITSLGAHLGAMGPGTSNRGYDQRMLI